MRSELPDGMIEPVAHDAMNEDMRALIDDIQTEFITSGTRTAELLTGVVSMNLLLSIAISVKRIADANQET